MPSSEQPRIGYVLKRYPRFSETFIVNEILAHEKAGLPIEIFALGPVEEAHFQDLIGLVRAPVVRLPHRLRNAEPLWQLIDEAGRTLPAFWPALQRLVAPGAGGVGDGGSDPADGGLDGESLAQALRLALDARARGIAHLHAHFATGATTVARAAAAFAGLSYSFTAHAKDVYFDYERPQQLARKLGDAAFAVTVSDFNLRHLQAGFGGQAGRLVRLYNGVDLERFAFQASAEGPPTIVAVGRLVDKKGFAVLIEAAAILRARNLAFHCEIVGDGPEREALTRRIDALGLGEQVRLVGARPQQDVIDAMRRATVLAMPCIVSADGNRDGLPTVLIEAMALGTPVIATTVTGIPELVRDGRTGLCVDAGDPLALANALERLLSDRSLRQRLARAAREVVCRDFDIDRNAGQLRSLFADAITCQRDRPS